MQCIQSEKGFSLIEVLIAAALIVMIFGGLFGSIRLTTIVIGDSKAKSGARSLAVEQMEFVRSLTYFSVGTVAGIPAGNVPQISTTTLNSIEYTIETLIQFLDRPEDGFGVADSNGITEDSKIAKVTISWESKGETHELILISDIIPRGIESTAGGGTLLINVFDANVLPVANADVHVYNDTISPIVDVTVQTNVDGIANFPGAPAGANYQITATKPGYSTDQTYSVTATNTSPIRTHVSVATATISTVNFEIDLLSDLTIKTVGTPVRTTFLDTFSNSNSIATSTDIIVSGGSVVLDGGPSSYETQGTWYATTTAPSTIDYWESIDFEGTTTANSHYTIHLYSVSGVGTSSVYTIIPDGDLPGNSTGFTDGPIDITNLSTSTYTDLALAGTLYSSSTNETAEVYDWELVHVESQPAIPSIPFTIEGAKSIGTFGGSPVLKYSSNDTTDTDGGVTISDLEFDDYDITLSTGAYIISEVYGGNPYYLPPGVNDEVTFVLASPVAYSLRVEVEDDSSSPIGGASVRLYDGGYDVTQTTSIYGQTLFDSGVASSSTYGIDVSATGYDPLTVTDFSITGNEEVTLQLADAGSGGGGESGGSGTSTGSTTGTYLPGYNTRIPITISDTTLFGNEVDFPVYLDLSDLPSSFFGAVQASGADIRFTSDDGLTEIPFEIVSIDTGGETGQVFFKAPSLLVTAPNEFYIYYGSSTAAAYADSDTYGSENVWTNNFLAVYHLEEDQAGSGNIDLYQDSTSNNAHGDDNVDEVDKIGKIGLGQRFQDSYTDNIELPYTVLDGETDVTLSFWYRTDSDDYMTVLSGAESNGNANEYLFWFQDRNDLEQFSHGTRARHDISWSIDDNVWRQYVAIRDDGANDAILYIDASEVSDSPIGLSMSTLDIAPGGLFIGVDQDSVGGLFDQELDGELDEVRISSGIRSSGWISNQHLNQNAPGTFYSIGSVETE